MFIYAKETRDWRRLGTVTLGILIKSPFLFCVLASYLQLEGEAILTAFL